MCHRPTLRVTTKKGCRIDGQLQNEFRQMSVNKLTIFDKVSIDFILSRRGLSAFLFSCQRLRVRAVNLDDEVVQKWKKSRFFRKRVYQMHNIECSGIPPTLCGESQLSNVTNGGVTEFYNSNDNATALMNVNVLPERIFVSTRVVREICAARLLENDHSLIEAVHITRNRAVSQITAFIHEVCLPALSRGSCTWQSFDKIPMILSDDLNTNIDSPEHSQWQNS